MSYVSRPVAPPPSTIISVLRCISSAAPAIPVPGVAAAVEVVIAILDLVELVRTSKRDCLSLAEKAAQLVLSLHTEASNLESNSPTYKNIQANIEPFRMVLQDIQKYTLIVTKLTWAKQAWKRKEILERIQELSRSLEDCYQNFQITSFVRLQALVTQFKTEHFITLDKLHQELAAFRRATIKASEDSAFQLTAATQTMGSLIGQVEANQRSDAQKTDRLLKGIAANFSGEPRNDDAEAGWVIPLREIIPTRVYISRTKDHAGITLAKYRNENVIVKRFHEAKKFLEEKELWRDIWHPHLPQIIGHSSQSERAPFLVLRGEIGTRDIRSFLHSSLEKDNITGLLNGLEILYGISSAINYLHSEDILTKKELLEFMQPRNILLSSHNRVLLGESLISQLASKRHVIECHRDAAMDIYLSSEFFGVCLEILVPNNRFTPLEVNSGQGAGSILRLLMSFPAIERAWLALNELKQNMSQLTFSDIRRVFLSINDLLHSRTYAPREDWDISTGDVGYVRNGKFICLENILAASGFLVDDAEVFDIICDPPRPFSKEIMPNGWIRYEFDSPIYAWFWHSGRHDIGQAAALQYLLKQAPIFLEKYQEHSLALTDIILVTNKPTLPRRWAEFSYRSLDDGNENPPEKVYFFLNATGNGRSKDAWGYWSTDPNWVEMPAGSVSNITDRQIRCLNAAYPQIFEFVQLEKEDGQSD